MSIQSAAKALLEADATLLAAATGGVYDFDETGRLGLNPTLIPGAFDSTTGLIKPCVLLKLRSETPDGILQDDAEQTASISAMLEVWCYQHSGYTTIETLRDRVYVLLQSKQFGGAFLCRWAGNLRGPRDDAMDAAWERSEYQVRALKSV